MLVFMQMDKSFTLIRRLTLPIDRWQMALNVLLPTDIRIVEVEYVDEDFHARYSATGKRIVYKWSFSEVHSPFERNFSVILADGIRILNE